MNYAMLGVVVVAACGASTPGAQAPAPVPSQDTFTVLPAESLKFPKAARAVTDRLQRARIRGLGEPELSKVSLEVVQIWIECVERSLDCFQAVGRELSARQLLFAELRPGPEPESVRVTVSLFDVDSKQLTRSVAKVFPTEDDVPYSIGELVAEVTKP